jgi:CubicO group peptidase (beta-lactamase class C family)
MPPIRCRNTVAVILILATALVSPGSATIAAERSGVEARIHRVETGLLPVDPGSTAAPSTIEERLRHYRVPGVSVAVIDEGRIAWARGWGEVEGGSGIPVDAGTLFQAASISKPVAAAGALRLVDRGEIDLDADVNGSLRSWRVPENRFTRTEKVTLRRLLSHSAGTTVHGFPGYAGGSPVPSLVQVLAGRRPSNTPGIRVDAVPGSRWRYSGGGTSVVQLLMSDVTGRPFEELMRDLVLGPVGMHDSTFEQPLPASWARRAAAGHRADGTPLPGRFHTYPEQAAAGLWTTPSDLARFVIAVQGSAGESPGALLPPELASLMLTRQAGRSALGFFVVEGVGSAGFEHGGSNAGFQSLLIGFAGSGQGAVVMTNGDRGGELAAEILFAIGREHRFPGFGS